MFNDKVPALLELSLPALSGVYEPPEMLCCVVTNALPFQVLSSSVPEIDPPEATVKVPATAIALSFASYPENWKA